MVCAILRTYGIAANCSCSRHWSGYAVSRTGGVRGQRSSRVPSGFQAGCAMLRAPGAVVTATNQGSCHMVFSKYIVSHLWPSIPLNVTDSAALCQGHMASWGDLSPLIYPSAWPVLLFLLFSPPSTHIGEQLLQCQGGWVVMRVDGQSLTP